MFILSTLCSVSLDGDVLEKVLVKVNGDIITQTDLEDQQVAYVRERRDMFDAADLETEEGLQRIIAEITPLIIADAISELLMVQRGRDLGYTMADDRFEEVVENIKKENNIESEEQFTDALKDAGMTIKDLRTVIGRQYLVNAVQQVEVFGKITVTDTEAREYYDAHLEEFTNPASVTLREVLARVPSSEQGVPNRLSSNGVDDEAKQRATEARGRVLSGEKFSVVAAEVSDSPSKANGGLVGPVNRDELADDVRELIERLGVGDVSAVGRTSQGHQFFKLESVTDASPPPFEELRDTIANDVFNERGRTALNMFLEKLQDEATIEWKDEAAQKAFERYVSPSGSSTEGSP